MPTPTLLHHFVKRSTPLVTLVNACDSLVGYEGGTSNSSHGVISSQQTRLIGFKKDGLNEK